MVLIEKSAGERGDNLSADVKKVQTLINYNLHLLTDINKLTVDGKIGALTIRAIKTY